MIIQIRSLLRRLRRLFSRTEWSIRLLKLARGGSAGGRGLILVQIDGLGREQFRRALDSGRLPFLKGLLQREGYREGSFYSGLPSTTPSVQGELFYGVKCAVPAFQYRSNQTGRLHAMFDIEQAARVEARLRSRGRNLLAGGSAYSDIYTGGAAQSSFCISSAGLDDVVSGRGFASLATVGLIHAGVLLRMMLLGGIEGVLAVTDVLRGVVSGRSLREELKFIPSRVAVCILVRELIGLQARMDIARNLPVVHCNFLGYDEQAHRRGPGSRFAHWSLRGIDNTIRSLWQAAGRYARRDYDLWVYSDHGQDEVDSYIRRHGRDVSAAVNEVLRSHGLEPSRLHAPQRREGARWARMLGGKRLQDLLYHPVESAREVAPVAAMGPVGHAYLDRTLGWESKLAIAEDLVRRAQVPAVGVLDDQDVAHVVCKAGTFRLPEQGGELIGEDHPFAAEIPADLAELISHPEAGTFVLLGGAPGERLVSFPAENGSHAGFSARETEGFCLLPADAPVQPRQDRYLRPLDLRRAAMAHLDGPPAARTPRRPSEVLRVLTYNVHHCRGMDGRVNIDRIARVIARCEPDVIALQELDAYRERSGGAHQAERIAECLEMRWHFHPSFSVENGHYGNAVLSRLPMREVRCDALPSAKHREGRGAIWVEIDAPGGPVQVLATHLDLRGRQRRSQIQALLGEDWLGRWDGRTPLVLCGDFNTPPGSPLWRLLSERLGDAGRMVADRPPATFLRAMRLDYVFVSASVRVLDVQVPSDRLARRASDHLPLWADLTFAREAAEAPTDADAPGPPGASTPPGETNSTCAS